MIVYHGSIVTVEKPIVKAGRANLDFGRGFYVTDIREQAQRWAERLARQNRTAPILNVYELDIDGACQRYRSLKFESYDRKWLEFIVNSRRGQKPWLEYDIIEGGVANDRVIDTIEAYISGLTTIDNALGQLALHRPNNQFCLLNQQLVDECLSFISANQL